MTATYRTAGSLTGTIERKNVATAQAYLTADDMTQYVYGEVAGVVENIAWRLSANGHDYTVTARTSRTLTSEELAQLASWVSGQNSDGLGEGFEQQDFARVSDGGSYSYSYSYGYDDGSPEEEEDGNMISFDWETNDSAFVLVG